MPKKISDLQVNNSPSDSDLIPYSNGQAGADRGINFEGLKGLFATPEFVEDKASLYVSADKTVNVPTDYPTLQDATNAFAAATFDRNIVVEIVMEEGFQPSSGITVDGGDFSHIIVRSVDPIVTVDDSFSGYMFRGRYAKMPILDCLIDMNGKGFDGYIARHSSEGRVLSGAGIMNCGLDDAPVADSRNGAQADGASHLDCDGGIFTGNAGQGIYASRGSSVSAANTDVSNNTKNGYHAFRGGIIYCEGGNAENCGTAGVRCRGSWIYARAVSCVGSEIGAQASEGGFINLWEGDVSNTDRGLFISSGGRMSAPNATAENCGHGIFADDGGYIDASDLLASGCTNRAIFARNNARVNAPNADCTGSGIRAESGGRINAPNILANDVGGGSMGVQILSASWANIEDGSVKNSSGRSIFADDNSEINAPNVDCSGGSSDGVRADNGARINFNNGNANGCNRGIYAFTGGRVHAMSATAIGCGDVGAQARDGGWINLKNADCSGSLGSNDLSCSEGSEMNAISCTTTNGAPDVGDISFVSNLNTSGKYGIVYG